MRLRLAVLALSLLGGGLGGLAGSATTASAANPLCIQVPSGNNQLTEYVLWIGDCGHCGEGIGIQSPPYYGC